MKKHLVSLTALFALALSACGNAAQPTAIPTVALNEPQASSSSASKTTSASAVVVPVETVHLSFPLSGSVKTVEVAEGDEVTAGQTLATLDTAILEARVKEAEAAVVTQQTTVAYLRRTGIDNERLLAAQANVDRAQAAVDIAKAQLAQATLTSPIDGTVAEVNIAPGEFALPGQQVFVIGDLSRFQIETTDLSEKDIPNIQIGQSVTIYIEALDEEFSGKVVDIARISQTVGGDVVFKVTVAFDSQPEGLRWGMSAEVKIEAK